MAVSVRGSSIYAAHADHEHAYTGSTGGVFTSLQSTGITGSTVIYTAFLQATIVTGSTVTGSISMYSPTIRGTVITGSTITGSDSIYTSFLQAGVVTGSTITGSTSIYSPIVRGTVITGSTVTGSISIYSPSITGDVIYGGVITGSTLTGSTLTVSSLITPSANNTVDLGTVNSEFKDAYFTGSLYVSGSGGGFNTLNVRGTSGNTLIVDTNTLVVDASNNRVGINTGSPGYELEINGGCYIKGAAYVGSSTSGDGSLNFYCVAGGYDRLNFMDGTTNTWNIAKDGSNNFVWRYVVGNLDVLKLAVGGTTFDPVGAGLVSTGNAVDYWNDVSYKTLSDRGCLGDFSVGVEMPDGKVLSDVEALKAIEVDETELTVYGVPRLKYSSMPKAVYKPIPNKDPEGNDWLIDEKGKEYYVEERSEYDYLASGSKLVTKVKYPAEGAELTALFSISIGAIKELSNKLTEIDNRLKLLEGR